MQLPSAGSSVAKCVRSVAAAASRRRASWLRMRPLRHQALAVLRLLVQWLPERAAPSQRCCKACCHAEIEHNAELCKVLCTAARLPVRIISRYV